VGIQILIFFIVHLAKGIVSFCHHLASVICRPSSVNFPPFNLGTGYDYPDLPGLGNNNEKFELPERLSTGIQFRLGTYFTKKLEIIARGIFYNSLLQELSFF
jgi:hypothetical protein